MKILFFFIKLNLDVIINLDVKYCYMGLCDLKREY